MGRERGDSATERSFGRKVGERRYGNVYKYRVPRTFGSWFAGFTDGEGSFVIAHSSSRATYTPLYSLTLRLDDVEVLQMIRNTLGFGNLRIAVADKRGGHPRANFNVWRAGDCLKLVELFDAYPLRAKKRRDYAIWRQAVLAFKFRKGRKDRTAKLAAAFDEIRAVREYVEPELTLVGASTIVKDDAIISAQNRYRHGKIPID